MIKHQPFCQPLTFKAQESPFLNAKNEWQDRIGSLVLQARNWRLAAFISGLVAIIVSAALIVQTNQRKIIPILVGLDSNRGEAIALGRAEDKVYQPKESELRYFLSRFILDVRSVPLDLVVLKQNIANAYHYLGKSAAEALSEMMQQDPNNPVRNPGKRAVSVQPISIVKIANSNSFQARWKESEFSPGGDHVQDYTMNATFTVDILPPTTEEEVMVNPLGIFIQSFSWNRELGEAK